MCRNITFRMKSVKKPFKHWIPHIHKVVICLHIFLHMCVPPVCGCLRDSEVVFLRCRGQRPLLLCCIWILLSGARWTWVHGVHASSSDPAMTASTPHTPSKPEALPGAPLAPGHSRAPGGVTPPCSMGRHWVGCQLPRHPPPRFHPAGSDLHMFQY